MNILVSACLLGIRCRYDGKSKPCPEVIRLKDKYDLIPVCPECYGGFPIPREPSEICGDKVVSRSGKDVTEQYRRGAEAALQLAKLFDCKAAILKDRSPSCGVNLIHSGKFDGTLISGLGITAALLKANSIPVYTPDSNA